MNPNHYEICKHCLNRKFDRKSGLYCGLTNRKPDFTGECPDYRLDEKAASLGQSMPGSTTQARNPKKMARTVMALGGAFGGTGWILSTFLIPYFMDDLLMAMTYMAYIGTVIFLAGLGYYIYLLISTQEGVYKEVIDEQEDDLDDEL